MYAKHPVKKDFLYWCTSHPLHLLLQIWLFQLIEHGQHSSAPVYCHFPSWPRVATNLNTMHLGPAQYSLIMWCYLAVEKKKKQFTIKRRRMAVHKYFMSPLPAGSVRTQYLSNQTNVSRVCSKRYFCVGLLVACEWWAAKVYIFYLQVTTLAAWTMEAVERSVSPFLEGEFVAVLITSIWMTIIQLVCVRLPQTHLFFSTACKTRKNYIHSQTW